MYCFIQNFKKLSESRYGVRDLRQDAERNPATDENAQNCPLVEACATEPDLGASLLEVYVFGSPKVAKIGRITSWEPALFWTTGYHDCGIRLLSQIAQFVVNTPVEWLAIYSLLLAPTR